MNAVKGPLALADMGSFYVGGEAKCVEFPPPLGPQTINDGAMYVRYMIPAERRYALPIVLVHGGQHTGMTWETTPDGREGWETMLVAAGFAVYNIDQPYRGRSGFDGSPFNAVRDGISAATTQPPIGIAGQELGLLFTRGGNRFPVNHIAQYAAQIVPDFYTPIAMGKGRPGECDPRAPKALKALLDDIGPAILLTHSQGGEVGWLTALQARDKVRAIAAVEPGVGCEVLDRADFPDIPVYLMWGDNLATEFVLTQAQLQACKTLSAQRPSVTVDYLPDAGIFGNGHMLMMEDNNRELLGRIVAWLAGVCSSMK
jgi:pimeloyl-ACP methyl ester carboxylesterase